MDKDNETPLYSRGDLVEWRSIDADIFTASGLAPKNEYNGDVCLGGIKFTRYQGYITEVIDDIATVLVSFRMENRTYTNFGRTETSLNEFFAIAIPEPKKVKYPLIMFRLIKKDALR